MDDEKEEGMGSSLTARDCSDSSLHWVQPPSEEQGGREEVISVVRPVPRDRDDWSIFPPKEHEDLYVRDESPVAEPSPSCFGGSDFASSALRPRTFSFSLFSRWRSCDRALWERRMLVEKTRFMELVRKLVDWGTGILCSWVPISTTMAVRQGGRGGGGAVGDGFWSVTAFTFVALAILYMRRKHRQERFRLLLLIHEKDKMIAQLLQKIVQMNQRTQHVPAVMLS